MWLTSTQSNPNRSGCPQEIDVVEQYSIGPGAASKARAALQPFNGTRASGCAKVHGQSTHSAQADFSSDWSLFALDWTDTWITMSVNGQLYANYEQISPSQHGTVSAFTDPLFLALTACVMRRVPPS
jgi:beta-glucanase (GH16 family)